MVLWQHGRTCTSLRAVAAQGREQGRPVDPAALLALTQEHPEHQVNTDVSTVSHFTCIQITQCECHNFIQSWICGSQGVAVTCTVVCNMRRHSSEEYVTSACLVLLKLSCFASSSLQMEELIFTSPRTTWRCNQGDCTIHFFTGFSLGIKSSLNFSQTARLTLPIWLLHVQTEARAIMQFLERQAPRDQYLQK
jgi:hypothetical protein